ncbi:nucleotidyltransferase family protein [Magnetofaba australis]|uniref:Putative nucleotidyl transferase n=1 Tax=Magnetofaba australis IT-1 TaxID=1434232 RepID=A0A1Y2K7X3_9PROT|nr:nucleotidyltransferase family protein [Magnetofaba australis]OSM06833.1 putative nucleotidyl transferase [Magnetofaba australis IT-1]
MSAARDAILSQIPVVILCGGSGVRLRPLTDTAPKGMVPVHGRPMLDHVVDFYRDHGARDITLCTGYRGDVIRDHYAMPPEGITLNFSDAGESASMLQRLWAARDHAGETSLVAYCDTMIDLDIGALLASHRDSSRAATIVTAAIRNPFGVVDFADDTVGDGHAGPVSGFREKPTFHYYIGCFLFQRRALELITPELLALPDGEGLVGWLRALIDAGQLHGFRHDGLQITFNTVSEHREAEQALARYYTYAESS